MEMNLLQQTMNRIEPLNEVVMENARERVGRPKSLGRLEDLAVQLAGIQGVLYPEVKRRAIIVMAADHGVYEEGISSNPQEVTYAQTTFIAKGLTGVGVLGKMAGAEIVAVDIGVKGDYPSGTEVIDRKIKNGTDNLAKGPAMTREEAICSLETGI